MASRKRRSQVSSSQGSEHGDKSSEPQTYNFGEVVWANTGGGYPTWPARIEFIDKFF